MSSWDTSSLENAAYMFAGCTSKEINISNFNTEKVTSMAYMFHNANQITVLDLAKFNTNLVKNMDNMFSYCGNLQTIYIDSGWTTMNVTNSTNMFLYCGKLKGAVAYNVSKVDASMANYTNGYLTFKA